MLFQDRIEAGEKLSDELKIKGDVLVLGIPRGGVILAKVIADKFSWPLDVLITKKISFSGQPELAMGAIAEDCEPVWDERLSQLVSKEDRSEQEQKAREKVDKYIKKFRGGRKLEIKGQTVIVVDDGVATGKTLEAGIKYLQGKALKVKKIVVAIPVCAKDTADRLKKLVLRVRCKFQWICLYEPKSFYAVGQFYKNFEQVSDEEVKELL